MLSNNLAQCPFLRLTGFDSNKKRTSPDILFLFFKWLIFSNPNANFQAMVKVRMPVLARIMAKWVPT
jgi:hypothetical protein